MKRIEDCHVLVMATNRFEESELFGPRETLLGKGAKVTLELDLASRFQSDSIPSTYSDQQGRFRLEGVDPGELSLVASQDGFASSEPTACEARAGELTQDVVLELRLGGTLTGEDFSPANHRCVRT